MNRSMDLKPIYTEPENCQDCYKCVRECPVKAIQIEDNKAYIIEERCIYRCKKDPGRGQPYPSYLAELSPGNLIPRPLLGL